MNNKKGLSTIVATVLIILITMAAVTVVWLAVMPLISKQTATSSSCFDAVTQISLVQGVTCIDGTTDINFVVKRGGGVISVDRIDLIAVSKDSSTKKISQGVSDLEQNTQKVYSMTAAEAGVIGDIVSVSIAPHVTGSKDMCDISSTVSVAKC
ncbi:MAG: hypothetical protein Q7S33_00935 [Nanoarchaeota archaeon]|nr:hypothetical protein [Nanoarchaeota archaeon]